MWLDRNDHDGQTGIGIMIAALILGLITSAVTFVVSFKKGRILPPEAG